MPQGNLYLPGRGKFYLDHAAVVFTSPFTRTEQRLRRPAVWKVELEWEMIDRQDALPLLAFFDKMNGQNDVFTLYDDIRCTPLGSVAGTPLVNGSGQTGTTLNTKGWTHNATGVLLAGDVFSIETTGEYFVVTDDVNAGPTGLAAVSIAPYIRDSPTNGKLIQTGTSAILKVRLDGPVIPQAVPPAFYSFTASMTEDLVAV
jgi:hypothetical protein